MTPHHNYMNYDEGYRIGEKGDAAIQHAHRPTVRGTNCRPAVCTPEGGPQPSGAHRSGCLAASSTAASQPACAAGLELFTSSDGLIAAVEQTLPECSYLQPTGGENRGTTPGVPPCSTEPGSLC
jgi:hypothetical protein